MFFLRISTYVNHSTAVVSSAPSTLLGAPFDQSADPISITISESISSTHYSRGLGDTQTDTTHTGSEAERLRFASRRFSLKTFHFRNISCLSTSPDNTMNKRFLLTATNTIEMVKEPIPEPPAGGMIVKVRLEPPSLRQQSPPQGE